MPPKTINRGCLCPLEDASASCESAGTPALYRCWPRVIEALRELLRNAVAGHAEAVVTKPETISAVAEKVMNCLLSQGSSY